MDFFGFTKKKKPWFHFGESLAFMLSGSLLAFGFTLAANIMSLSPFLPRSADHTWAACDADEFVTVKYAYLPKHPVTLQQASLPTAWVNSSTLILNSFLGWNSESEHTFSFVFLLSAHSYSLESVFCSAHVSVTLSSVQNLNRSCCMSTSTSTHERTFTLTGLRTQHQTRLTRLSACLQICGGQHNI